MKNIYIDVTSLTEVDFVTGIQRVVKNVLIEMKKIIPEEMVLIAYSANAEGFVKINQQVFFDYYSSSSMVDKKRFLTKDKIEFSEMDCTDVFFDIDSVWNSAFNRSLLYPMLKKYGVKIAVYVYDIIPITEPQFCHEETIFRFLSYAGAFLQHADIVITSTKSTLDEVYKLANRLGTKRMKGSYSWLGSDFNSCKQDESETIENKVKQVSESKYILCVGTIEPRKNHAFLLDVFEEELFEKNINLVFAGKMGWNVEELAERIKNHKYLNQKLFYFNGLNDASIAYLYESALMLAFPTYNEGFGLPIVESLERGTPVIASDIPVLREVGKEYCEYFKLNDKRAFADKVMLYSENIDIYNKMKNRIREYTSFTWKETAECIIAALEV